MVSSRVLVESHRFNLWRGAGEVMVSQTTRVWKIGSSNYQFCSANVFISMFLFYHARNDINDAYLSEACCEDLTR